MCDPPERGGGRGLEDFLEKGSDGFNQRQLSEGKSGWHLESTEERGMCQ